jgi:hypothetical protein
MESAITRWEKIVIVTMKIILFLFAVVSFLRKEYVWTIGIIFSIFLTQLPTIIKRDFNVQIPIIFDIVITLSVFLHIIGGYLGLYWFIPYYDNLTHFLSSMTISLIGVTFLYILAFSFNLVKLPPLGFGIFTVLFAMGMGVIWEMLEWFFDVLLSTDLQFGLHNTMWDLTFDTLAGIIVGTVATIKLKRGEKLETEIIINMNDLKKSIGYKRLKVLTETPHEIRADIVKSFKDHKLLEKFINTIMEESIHIKQKEKEFWRKLKGNSTPNGVGNKKLLKNRKK